MILNIQQSEIPDDIEGVKPGIPPCGKPADMPIIGSCPGVAPTPAGNKTGSYGGNAISRLLRVHYFTCNTNYRID